MARADWSTQQLVEFLAAVSSTTDEERALRAAVEHAAEGTGAEMAALVHDEALGVTLGIPAGVGLEEAVLEFARSASGEVEVEGVGRCWGIAAPLEWPPSSRLVLARFAEPFTTAEVSMVRAMARVLALTLRAGRRQRLLERVTDIQRLIS